MQGAIRAIGQEKLKHVLCEATKAFRLEDGSIHIQPNIFKYVVAVPTAD
jgi:hypothetical protein